MARKQPPLGRLKEIVNLFPLLTVLLTLIGYLHLTFYYSHWGINIAEYLTFTEIILSFLKAGLFFIACVVAYIFLGGIYGIIFSPFMENFEGMRARQQMREKKKEKKDFDNTHTQSQYQIHFETPKEDDNRTNEMKESNKSRKSRGDTIGVIIGISISLIIMYFLYRGSWVNYHFGWAIFANLFIFMILLILIGFAMHMFEMTRRVDDPHFRFKELKVDDLFLNPKTLVPAIVLLVVSATVFYSHYEVHWTETKPPECLLELKNDAPLHTDSNFIFVGKTENFYFFYNLNGKETAIYPVAEVKSFRKRN
jgi:hypothetical protein